MRRAPGRGSVRTQTTLVAAGVVALVLVISAVGLTGLVRHRLVDAERVAARVRADDVVALARTGRLPNPLAYPGEESGATQVLDSKGTVIDATGNLEDEPALSELRPDVGDHESEILTDVPLEDDDRYVIVATTAEVSGDNLTVLAAASLESADATVAPEDLLTADTFPSADATVAPGDLLTADNFPSADASASAGDLLTPDSFPSGAASLSPDPGGTDIPGVDPTGTSDIDLGFILERWQAPLPVAVAGTVAVTTGATAGTVSVITAAGTAGAGGVGACNPAA